MSYFVQNLGAECIRVDNFSMHFIILICKGHKKKNTLFIIANVLRI